MSESEKTNGAWDDCVQSFSRSTGIGLLVGFSLAAFSKAPRKLAWSMFGMGLGGGLAAGKCEKFIWKIPELEKVK